MLDWGVICGVGNIGGRGIEGSSIRGVGSNVMSVLLRKPGICSWMDGRLVVGSKTVGALRGDGESAMGPESRPDMPDIGVAGSMSTVSNSGVSRGMTARQE